MQVVRGVDGFSYDHETNLYTINEFELKYSMPYEFADEFVRWREEQRPRLMNPFKSLPPLLSMKDFYSGLIDKSKITVEKIKRPVKATMNYDEVQRLLYIRGRASQYAPQAESVPKPYSQYDQRDKYTYRLVEGDTVYNMTLNPDGALQTYWSSFMNDSKWDGSMPTIKGWYESLQNHERSTFGLKVEKLRKTA